MTVKKKSAAQKSRPAKKMSTAEHQAHLKKSSEVIQNTDLNSVLTPAEIEKAHGENAKEVNLREAAKAAAEKAIAADAKMNQKLADKRISQVLKNDLVKVEVIDPKLPVDPVPINCSYHVDGLLELKIKGTHLRLLTMADPSETPSTEQRVAMAKRLNEVGPYLPRYIKNVSLKDGRGLSAEEVKESQDRSKGIAEGRAAAASNNSNEPSTVKKKKRTAEATDSTPKAASIPGGVPLKKICASLNVDPKLARRILRSSGAKPGGRWEWPESEVEAVKKAIKAGADAIEDVKEREKMELVDSTIKATTNGGGK